jgi:nucleoside-diphosphate-sugar epimerase
MKILITGGNGYIAKSIYSHLHSKYDITTISRTDFDLVNWEQTNNWFKGKQFDIVIHTAAVGGSRLKKDDNSVLDANIKMYYNLLDQKDKYNKFIYFGSGAEHNLSTYGISKFIINQSIKDKANFYNLRIFGVFDENEIDTRFIKSNIKRYINKEAIQIFEDKMMDFIYMPDLISIVDHYINVNDLPKDIDCIYPGMKSYLYDIAEIINKLDEYEVPILTGKTASHYIGYLPIDIEYIGLKNGIQLVYEKLRKNEN